MSKVIKLNESELHKIVSESIRNILSEISTDLEGCGDMGFERASAARGLMQSTGYQPREMWSPEEGNGGEKMVCDVMIPGEDMIHKVAIYSSKHFVYDQGLDAVKSLFPDAKVLGVGMNTNVSDKWC